MPLIQSKSKKALEKNIATEIKAHPADRKRDLAIAFSVKRKPKKMVKGGEAQLNAMEVTPDKGYGKIIRVGMADGGMANDENENSDYNRSASKATMEANSRNIYKPSEDNLINKTIKMAEGGSISAKTEKRPMSDQSYNDSEMERKNKGMKAPKQDSWTDTPTETQAMMNNGRKVMPIARPKMVPSNAFSTKLYNKEGMLEETAKPGPYGEQPSREDDEMEADKSGDPVRKDPIHSKNLNKYAKGGMINDVVSMKDAEEDEVQYPAGLEMDNDEMSPSEKDIMSGHMKMLAEGGMADDMDQPEHEEEEEHHSSIAAAIMAKREKMHAMIDSGSMDEDHAVKMANGGILSHDSIYSDASDMADLSRNHDEDANEEDQLSFNALRKENYNSSNLTKNQPMDSNEHGDSREDNEENKHDMISSIRRKMMSKRR